MAIKRMVLASVPPDTKKLLNDVASEIKNIEGEVKKLQKIPNAPFGSPGRKVYSEAFQKIKKLKSILADLKYAKVIVSDAKDRADAGDHEAWHVANDALKKALTKARKT